LSDAFEQFGAALSLSRTGIDVGMGDEAAFMRIAQPSRASRSGVLWRIKVCALEAGRRIVCRQATPVAARPPVADWHDRGAVSAEQGLAAAFLLMVVADHHRGRKSADIDGATVTPEYGGAAT
jgi:hypothetical protein